VIDELDAQKVTNSNLELRERAKEVVGRIRALTRDGSETLRNGASLSIRVKRHGKDLVALGLDPSIRDDHLLAEILGAKEEHPGRHVLLTSDFGPELRSRSIGIEAVSPGDDLRLAVPDSRERELRKTKNELQRALARRPTLVLLHRSGELYERFSVSRPKPLSEADIEAQMLAVRKKSPVMTEQPPEPGFVTEVLGSFARLAGLDEPTNDEIGRYNDKVSKYLSDYEDYLRRQWLTDEEVRLRTIEVAPFFRNDGAAEATNVRIQMFAPSVAALSKNPPKGPRSPKSPSPPVRPTGIIDLGRIPGHGSMPVFPQPPPNVAGPWLIEGPTGRFAKYRIGRAQHKQGYELDPLFLTFPSIDEMASLSLPFRLIARELPDWVTGDLHVVINVVP
jgi:hypothetical protein